MRRIYLDYNATTPIAPFVQQAMLPFLAEHFGDPSSNHAVGRAAGEAVEDARGSVASLLGADRDEIVFTSGGTESNLLALLGPLLARKQPGGHVVISALEHESVIGTAGLLSRLGYDVSVAAANGQGIITAAAVRQVLRPETVLVSVMHANHEIGTLQPLRPIAAVCRDQGALFHTDASQSVGKIRTLIDELEVDLLTISGHKLYAPKGVGALYVRTGVPIDAVHCGDGQESGLRSGTENVPGVVGLGKACELIARSLEDAVPRMETLRNRFETRLQEAIGHELVIHGRHSPRLPNTSSVGLPGVHAHEVLDRIPELCAATGSASYSPTHAVSSTLAALGVNADIARGTLRISLGWYSEEDEIDRAVDLLLEAWEAVR